MDRTSAALGNTAAKFGTGHSQQVAKDPKERHVVRSVDTFIFAIDLQCHHDEPSRFAYHLRVKFRTYYLSLQPHPFNWGSIQLRSNQLGSIQLGSIQLGSIQLGSMLVRSSESGAINLSRPDDGRAPFSSRIMRGYGIGNGGLICRVFGGDGLQHALAPNAVRQRMPIVRTARAAAEARFSTPSLA